MAALWCAIALAAAWALLSALFVDQVRRGFDGNLAAQLEGVIAASEWREGAGPGLRRPLPDPRFQQPLSGWYWQISDADGPVLRSRSLWDGDLPIAKRTGANEGISYHDIAGPNGVRLRLAARRLTLAGVEGTFLFQLAGDSAAHKADIARFDRLLAMALGILGLGLIGAMVLVVQIGLRPLARIGQALGDIRAGRADRLHGAFPSEIQPLADEIDTLLDHQAAVIGRARGHAGDLAHALKTPLAVLVNEAEGDKSALAAQVRHQVVEMRRQVDRHLSRARTAASAGILGARCDIAPVLEDLIRVLGRLHRDRGIGIDLELAKPAPAFAGEREDLQEMLGNLLENACQWANSRVRVGVGVGAGAAENRVLFAIEDDGPGLPPEQRQEVMARGARLDESKPGSGLGLAIVADMAELYQGELSLGNSELGGLSARRKLPLAP
jgi:signal transduction histidine kinase